MIKQLLKDLKNLISGMGITGKHLGRRAVTIQYPEEKMEMPERSRGVVVLLSDTETGELNCTGCLLCMKACPTAAILIDAPRDPETKRRTVKSFQVDHSLCCYCGLCEEACNFAAIKLATKYEFATYDKDEVLWDMNKLQEVGLDVPYEKPVKKRPKKKATAKKPEKKPEKKADDTGGEKSEEKKEGASASKTATEEEKREAAGQEEKPADRPTSQQDEEKKSAANSGDNTETGTTSDASKSDEASGRQEERK